MTTGRSVSAVPARKLRVGPRAPRELQSHLSRLRHSCPRVDARAPAGTRPPGQAPGILVLLTPEHLGGGVPASRELESPVSRSEEDKGVLPSGGDLRGKPHPASRDSPTPQTSQSLQHSLQPFGKDFVPFPHTSYKDGVIFRSSQSYQGAPRVLEGSPHCTRAPGANLTCRPRR